MNYFTGASCKPGLCWVNRMCGHPVNYSDMCKRGMHGFLRMCTQKYPTVCETTRYYSQTPSAPVITNLLHHLQGLWHRTVTWLSFGF